MWKVKIPPRAIHIGKREGVSDAEMRHQIKLVEEIAQYQVLLNDARVTGVQFATLGILYRIKEIGSPIRTLIEKNEYTLEAQTNTGSWGVLRILGFYRRDDDTYIRARKDYEDTLID
jgi:hypothetical protein